MKSKLILLLHKIIKKFKLENIVIMICILLNIPTWKALPQNINYRDNDKIKIKRNKIKYIVNRNDFTQWQIYANYPELHYEAFIQNGTQGNVIDVGANIGSFSLRVAKYFRDNKSNNKVYAFEPFQKIFNILEKICHLILN